MGHERGRNHAGQCDGSCAAADSCTSHQAASHDEVAFTEVSSIHCNAPPHFAFLPPPTCRGPSADCIFLKETSLDHPQPRHISLSLHSITKAHKLIDAVAKASPHPGNTTRTSGTALPLGMSLLP